MSTTELCTWVSVILHPCIHTAFTWESLPMTGTLHTSQYIVQFLLKYLIDLALEFLNSNKSVEMSQILDNVQRL